MKRPIELIERELNHTKSKLEDLEKQIKAENSQVLNTAGEIRVLKKEIQVFEDAMALLKGKGGRNE